MLPNYHHFDTGPSLIADEREPMETCCKPGSHCRRPNYDSLSRNLFPPINYRRNPATWVRRSLFDELFCDSGRKKDKKRIREGTPVHPSCIAVHPLAPTHRYREELAVHPPAIEVHPPILHIHPPGISLAALGIGLASIYIGLVDGKKALYLRAFFVRLIRRRLSRKRAFFVSEKAQCPRVFFVCLIRRRLSRKRALYVSEKALYLRVFFVCLIRRRLLRKRALFVSEKALYPRAFSEAKISSFFRSLSLYR